MKATEIIGQGTGLVGTAASLLSGAGKTSPATAKNKNLIEQQKRANESAAETNYNWGEKAAAGADKRTRELYSDLYSPSAIMAQIKAAGGNPAAVFGSGQFSPATIQGAQGETGGAQTAPVSSASQLMSGKAAIMQAGLSAASITADINLKNAQAENLRADTGATSGYRKDEAESRTGLNMAQTGIANIDQQIRTYQSAIEAAKVPMAEGMAFQTYRKLRREAEILDEAYNKAFRENRIGANTEDEAIEAIKLQNQEAIVRIAESIARKELTEEQTNQIKNYIRNYGAELPPWTQFYNNVTGILGGGEEHREKIYK